MSLFACWERSTRAAIDVVFPKRCASCRRRGAWVCSACRSQLLPDAPPLCPGCGIPVAAGPCRCDRLPPALTAIRSFGPYDGWLRDAIIAMKYAGEWGRQEHLGAALAEVVARTPADAILVPVPLHRGRLRERGFNQSELLARAASRSLGRPLVAALERQRATPHQVGLGGVERQANVAGAFRLAAGCDVAGETVVLVDDVLTTRATLGECGRILRHGGAREVWAAVLARE